MTSPPGNARTSGPNLRANGECASAPQSDERQSRPTANRAASNVTAGDGPIVRRLTGCPNGCEIGFHEEFCGLDAFIRERRARRDALDRRWRERAEHEAWLRHWGAA